jgi:hypothetical protein
MEWKTISDLWKNYYFINTNKECDKEPFSWGMTLLFLYNGKINNGSKIDILDFIELIYNKMENDIVFFNAVNKIYKSLYTSLISGCIKYE